MPRRVSKRYVYEATDAGIRDPRRSDLVENHEFCSENHEFCSDYHGFVIQNDECF